MKKRRRQTNSTSVSKKGSRSTRFKRHVCHVRVDDQEMNALRKLAKKRGVTVSVVLRGLIRSTM